LPNQRNPESESQLACVADLRELCAEFQAAISALTADNVVALEAAIATQETLADKLQAFLNSRPPVSPVPIEARELISVTRVYSALLKRAMRSVRLRSSLCRTYKQNFPTTSGEPVAATSWSCEV
jgi:hypothetical protein